MSGSEPVTNLKRSVAFNVDSTGDDTHFSAVATAATPASAGSPTDSWWRMALSRLGDAVWLEDISGSGTGRTWGWVTG